MSMFLQAKDNFKAFLTNHAKYTPNYEFPIIENWMIPNDIPLKIIPFDKIKNHRDLSDTYVCFYCQDERFTNILTRPNKYLKLFKRCKGIIGFDFSIHDDMPIAVQNYYIYINLALSFFYGLHKIQIIPNIRFGSDEFVDEFLKAIPKKSLIAIGTHGFCKTIDEKKEWIKTLSIVIKTLEPNGVIVYGSKDKRIFSCFPNTKFFFYDSWTSRFWEEHK